MKQTSEAVICNAAERPCSFYMEKYRLTDPVKISNRLGIPFDMRSRQFRFTFLGRDYTADHPELHIRCTEGRDPFSLDSSEAFRSLLLRFFLFSAVYPCDGDFRPIRDLPAGEAAAARFEENCVRLLTRRYGRVLQGFEAIMEDLDGIRVFGADIAYEVEFLNGLFIRFQFQRTDRMGEPSAGILFSGNFPAAFAACELEEVILLCMKAFDDADPLLAAANPYH